MQVNLGGELDTAVDSRRRCIKNSLSVLSCIDKKTKEGCEPGSKVGQFTAGEVGENTSSSKKNMKESGKSEKDFVSR